MKPKRPTLLMRPVLILALLTGLLAGVHQRASAAVVPLLCYVKADALGTNTGGSWTDAYTDLQSALGTSLCTEVWVASGTYKPTLASDVLDPRTKSFALKSGVTLYGGFAGGESDSSARNPVLHPVILSGDIGTAEDPSDNAYHVLTANAVDNTAILDGFTVTGGNANGASALNIGAGLYNLNSSPQLANMVFSNNAAGHGGGIYNNNSSPHLTNVTFTGNSATNEGGGMKSVSGGAVVLTNVVFDTNHSDGGGGGMLSINNPATLTNVVFSGNSAGEGGGMLNYGSNASLTAVTFTGNSAQNGGGMWNTGSSPSLHNVTFTANSALGYYGGGMYNWSYSNPGLTNVTFSGNTAAVAGGAINNDSYSNPIIINSILYGDTGGEFYNTNSSAPVVSFSDVQGGGSGTAGNIDADPLLGALQDNGGFTQTMTLGWGSPAIDSGDDLNCSVTDQRGVARPKDGNGDTLAHCDMGATESAYVKAVFTSSGAVDGSVLESKETSSLGGSRNSTARSFNVGDDAANRQYRGILSFDTSSLPDTATLFSVALKVRRAAIVGTNPFSTLGKIVVDVRTGAFSDNVLLQNRDFQAPATRNAVATISSSPVFNSWYSKSLAATSFGYVSLTGTTQFRLRFAKDDNNNLVADYVQFYSGNAAAANRPQLVIKYYAP